MGRRAAIAGVLLAACAALWLASFALAPRPRSAGSHARAAPGPVGERAGPAADGAAGHPGRSGAAASDPPRSGAATAPIRSESSDEVRARLAREAAEQRARNDARYAELAQRWSTEARDEPWAKEREQALRAAAVAGGLDALVIEIACKRSLCRLEISAADSNTAFALQRARGFTAAMGTDTGAGMIGGGPDRALEVFAAREGMGAAKGP